MKKKDDCFTMLGLITVTRGMVYDDDDKKPYDL